MQRDTIDELQRTSPLESIKPKGRFIEFLRRTEVPNEELRLHSNLMSVFYFLNSC